ncbi:MAG: hypothetical protein ACI9R3_000274 [Verrucomicrobiales bacterium]|jgi:hypothetical protein
MNSRDPHVETDSSNASFNTSLRIAEKRHRHRFEAHLAIASDFHSSGNQFFAAFLRNGISYEKLCSPRGEGASTSNFFFVRSVRRISRNSRVHCQGIVSSSKLGIWRNKEAVTLPSLFLYSVCPQLPLPGRMWTHGGRLATVAGTVQGKGRSTCWTGRPQRVVGQRLPTRHFPM